MHKASERARHPWLTPVILATQETAIRRITVLNQPWANSLEILSRKKAITIVGLVEWLKDISPRFKT
jgi:hypothetical protein